MLKTSIIILILTLLAAASCRGAVEKRSKGLLKYSGVFGFALYLFTLLGTRYTMGRICWVLIVCLILVNEPFLTAGPFWWGVPFIMDYMPEPSSTTDLKSNGYVAQT